MEPKLVTIDQIIQARERLPSAVVHTPMLYAEELSHRLHVRVYFKREHLQVFAQQVQIRNPVFVR